MKFEVHENDGPPDLALHTSTNQPEEETPAAILAKAHPAILNSLLPTLSSVGTGSTNTPGSASGPAKPGISESAENFFYKQRRPTSDRDSVLLDSVTERLGPQLVTPKSRFGAQVIPSSLLESKENHAPRMLGMVVNRSTTNLHGLGRKSSSSAEFPGLTRARSSLSKPFPGFQLGNNSSSSLAIAEGEQSDEPEDKARKEADLTFEKSFDIEDNLYDDDPKLAPYGGFSRPNLEDQFANQELIFESAPWRIVNSEAGNGLLVNAVNLAQDKGIVKSVRWVGVMSLPTDAIPDSILEDISEDLSSKHDCDPVIVDDLVFQGHYKSFCKQILWPSLHYQIPDDPKSKAFEEHSYKYYKLLNQLVADKIVEVYKRENAHLPDDDPENIIWIHDYHLLLVPEMIRKELPQAKIGFFLHVSFPSSEVFRCFAQRTALLKGILGSDSIGFQTPEYGRHCLQTCNRLLLADTSEHKIFYNGRVTLVGVSPVGIDADHLVEVLNKHSVKEWRKMIKERWRGQHLIVSRDKLDKLRGIKQKFLAYEKFLLDNPERVYDTVMIQIFIGSVDDEDYESELMLIVSRINALPENISTAQPVVVLRKDIDFEQYLALQAEADVFIVSSMREGLNLTCHEFIVATSEKKSPLVLSEFTGSSYLLSCDGEGAFLINPWDKKHFSEAIKQALDISPSELELRWNKCNKVVRTHDSVDWVKKSIGDLLDGWNEDHRRSSTMSNPLSAEQFQKFYTSTKGKRLFFINLDGTSSTDFLNGTTAGQKKGLIEFGRIARLMSEILTAPNNEVYVVSYLQRSDLERYFKNVPNIGLIAESGGLVKLCGSSVWLNIYDDEEVKNWKPQVEQLIRAKAERLPGSSAVVEDCSVRMLMSSSIAEDPQRCKDAMGDIIQHINESYERSTGVHASIINDVVVVHQRDVALRAFKFIMEYYSSDDSAVSLLEKYDVGQKCSRKPDLETAKSRREPATAVFYAGGLHGADEPNYECAEELERNKCFQNIITVAVTGENCETRTLAKFGVRGQNELFKIIEDAVKANN